ncbi:hypothetical protein ACS0TY_003638 [Phlomoides rotata]
MLRVQATTMNNDFSGPPKTRVSPPPISKNCKQSPEKIWCWAQIVRCVWTNLRASNLLE